MKIHIIGRGEINDLGVDLAIQRMDRDTISMVQDAPVAGTPVAAKKKPLNPGKNQVTSPHSKEL